MVEILIFSVLAAYSGWVVVRRIKDIRAGRCSCSCSGCNGCKGCQKK